MLSETRGPTRIGQWCLPSVGKVKPVAAMTLAIALALGCKTTDSETSPPKPTATGALGEPPAPSAPEPEPRELEVELLYSRVSANSIAVDDEWIYFLINSVAARAPKRPGEREEVEQIGRATPSTPGTLMVDGGTHVYWGSEEALESTAKLYVYEKSSGKVETVDLGFTNLISTVRATDEYVVVFAVDCVGAASVRRDTLEVTLIYREDATYSGGSQASVAHGEYAYCQDRDVIYRAPIEGGNFESMVTIDVGIQGLFAWGTQLLYAGGAPPRGGAGLVELLGESAALVPTKEPLHVADANPIYANKQRSIYWLSRFRTGNRLVFVNVDTWARAQAPVPEGIGPSSGIAEDDDYLYWGDNDSTPALYRIRKPTIGDLKVKFGEADPQCGAGPSYPGHAVCWEEPPIPGLVATNAAQGNPPSVPSPSSAAAGDNDAAPPTAVPSASDAGWRENAPERDARAPDGG